MRFSGWPSKRAANTGDQPIRTPQLLARKSAIRTPWPRNIGTHAPSEPMRGQDAPPSASKTASGRTASAPEGVSKARSPCAFSRASNGADKNFTPRASSRCSQARSSGAAFSAVGKIRPELPMNHVWPRPSHQACKAAGGNAARAAAIQGAASP